MNNPIKNIEIPDVLKGENIMAIHSEIDSFICDTCEGLLKKDTVHHQMLIPEGKGFLNLKFCCWNCLSVYVMKKIMDDFSAQNKFLKDLEKNEG
jgi:hypothetical protein